MPQRPVGYCSKLEQNTEIGLKLVAQSSVRLAITLATTPHRRPCATLHRLGALDVITGLAFGVVLRRPLKPEDQSHLAGDRLSIQPRRVELPKLSGLGRSSHQANVGDWTHRGDLDDFAFGVDSYQHLHLNHSVAPCGRIH